MNLHNIRVAALEALVWAFPIGGNGHYLTAPRGSWRPTGHLYLAQRGTPTPLTEWGRQYWQPWNGYGVFEKADPLVPLCGKLPSRARRARLSSMAGDYPPDRYCEECLRLNGGRGESTNALIMRDPWSAIPRTERRTTLDPITGT